MDAIEEIAAERKRQIEAEGWTAQHDDRHVPGQLSEAAAAYALAASASIYGDPPPCWPWSMDWWKPTTRRRDLVKAAALIVAEIERIDRAALGGSND